MMADLKPCPFCGGEALGPTDAWPHMIGCSQCGAGVKGFDFAEDGEREAIKKWNRRRDVSLEWLLEKMEKPKVTCGNPFGFVLAKWLEEQEEEK